MNQITTPFPKVLMCLALSASALSSCTKVERSNKVKQQVARHKYQPTITTMSANLSIFENNDMNWADLELGYDDVNIGYNKAKLFLSIGLAEVAKDQVIADWIVSQAKVHEDNVFYFDELFDQFPETKAIIESTVDPLGEMTGWTFEEVQEKMQYEDYDIKASIYLTNTEIADASLKPIVTPGYDIMQEDENHPSDVVLGLYINNNNEVSRVNLWKEVIDGVTAPIFAIDGRATNKPPIVIVGTLDTPTGAVAQRAGSNQFNITKFVIGKRYESSGNSELAITGKCFFFPYQGSAPLQSGIPNPSAYSRNFLRKNGCGTAYDLDFEIASVSPSVANSWAPVDIFRYFCWGGLGYSNNFQPEHSEGDSYAYLITSGPAAGNYQSANGRKRLYFNTYENDGWPTSLKTLSPASINGVPLGLKGRMGTYNEWYMFNPYNAAQWLTTNSFMLHALSYPHDFYNDPSKGGWFRLDLSGWCQ